MPDESTRSSAQLGLPCYAVALKPTPMTHGRAVQRHQDVVAVPPAPRGVRRRAVDVRTSPDRRRTSRSSRPRGGCPWPRPSSRPTPSTGIPPAATGRRSVPPRTATPGRARVAMADSGGRPRTVRSRLVAANICCCGESCDQSLGSTIPGRPSWLPAVGDGLQHRAQARRGVVVGPSRAAGEEVGRRGDVARRVGGRDRARPSRRPGDGCGGGPNRRRGPWHLLDGGAGARAGYQDRKAGGGEEQYDDSRPRTVAVSPGTPGALFSAPVGNCGHPPDIGALSEVINSRREKNWGKSSAERGRDPVLAAHGANRPADGDRDHRPRPCSGRDRVPALQVAGPMDPPPPRAPCPARFRLRRPRRPAASAPSGFFSRGPHRPGHLVTSAAVLPSPRARLVHPDHASGLGRDGGHVCTCRDAATARPTAFGDANNRPERRRAQDDGR